MATIRPRNSAAPFEIHHDEMDGSTDEEHPELEDSRVEEGEDDEEDALSEASEESDHVVDLAVQEDIEKFKCSFEGITERFRLISRIGEGKPL
jgi:hypothetical protein